MIEVKVFRESLRTWLLSIDDLADLVGTRVWYGWPIEPPTFPCVTFSLRRQPLGDYPGHAWQGECTLVLHATDPDDLDTGEDAIVEWIADAANVVESTLSVADQTACRQFTLTEVGSDQYGEAPEPEHYLIASRDITFAFALVGLA